MLDHTLVGVLVTLFSRLVEAWSRATRDVGALEESGRAERSHKVKVGILGTVPIDSVVLPSADWRRASHRTLPTPRPDDSCESPEMSNRWVIGYYIPDFLQHSPGIWKTKPRH